MFLITYGRHLRRVADIQAARREALTLARYAGRFDGLFRRILAYRGGPADFGPVCVRFVQIGA